MRSHPSTRDRCTSWMVALTVTGGHGHRHKEMGTHGQMGTQGPTDTVGHRHTDTGGQENKDVGTWTGTGTWGYGHEYRHRDMGTHEHLDGQMDTQTLWDTWAQGDKDTTTRPTPPVPTPVSPRCPRVLTHWLVPAGGCSPGNPRRAGPAVSPTAPGEGTPDTCHLRGGHWG